MSKLLNAIAFTATALFATEKLTAQEETGDNLIHLGVTTGYTQYITPAAHTQKPFSLGLTAELPVPNLPLTFKAGVAVPVAGKQGVERNKLDADYPMIKDYGNLKAVASADMMAKVRIGGGPDDDLHDGFGFVAQAGGGEYFAKNGNYFGLTAATGLDYKNNGFEVTALIGKNLHKTPMKNQSVQNPNWNGQNDEWVQDPGNSSSLVTLTAKINIF